MNESFELKDFITTCSVSILNDNLKKLSEGRETTSTTNTEIFDHIKTWCGKHIDTKTDCNHQQLSILSEYGDRSTWYTYSPKQSTLDATQPDDNNLTCMSLLGGGFILKGFDRRTNQHNRKVALEATSDGDKGSVICN